MRSLLSVCVVVLIGTAAKGADPVLQTTVHASREDGFGVIVHRDSRLLPGFAWRLGFGLWPTASKKPVAVAPVVSTPSVPAIVPVPVPVREMPRSAPPVDVVPPKTEFAADRRR